MSINIWGICEYGEISHDPLRRWDCVCTLFDPREDKRSAAVDKCFANCACWLSPDENLEQEKK